MRASQKRVLASFWVLAVLALVVSTSGLREGFTRAFVSTALPTSVVETLSDDFSAVPPLEPRTDAAVAGVRAAPDAGAPDVVPKAAAPALTELLAETAPARSRNAAADQAGEGAGTAAGPTAAPTETPSPATPGHSKAPGTPATGLGQVKGPGHGQGNAHGKATSKRAQSQTGRPHPGKAHPGKAHSGKAHPGKGWAHGKTPGGKQLHKLGPGKHLHKPGPGKRPHMLGHWKSLPSHGKRPHKYSHWKHAGKSGHGKSRGLARGHGRF